MPTSYDNADEDVMNVVSEMMSKYHPDLAKANVKVQVLMAHNEAGDAVKLRGWPCFATIRKTTLKQRVAGMKDAEMVIDGDKWADLSAPERNALIDHELTHLEVTSSGKDGYETDDTGRPKISIRLHDYELAGFKEVMKRHKDAAIETQNAAKWQAEYEQLMLDYSQRG